MSNRHSKGSSAGNFDMDINTIIHQDPQMPDLEEDVSSSELYGIIVKDIAASEDRATQKATQFFSNIVGRLNQLENQTNSHEAWLKATDRNILKLQTETKLQKEILDKILDEEETDEEFEARVKSRRIMLFLTRSFELTVVCLLGTVIYLQCR